jgi:predicted ATP-grasp superfamily ATP-dependent carboligase
MVALRKWIGERGLPVVLKTDGSASGEGVRVAATLGQAEGAFRALRAPLSFVRMAKRALVNSDLRWVRPTLERHKAVVNAQEFIGGRDATSLVACWQGKVLAGLHFEVINKQYPRGPASVMRLIENIEMVVAIQKIVRRLDLSGLCGFDFLLQGDGNTPYLIEMNPRATQVGHLTLGSGRDLPAALYSALTATAIREARSVTDNSTIALFPQELMRDPESPFLRSAYHDIPWEEPELVRACLRKIRKWTDWRPVEELIQTLSRHRPKAL